MRPHVADRGCMIAAGLLLVLLAWPGAGCRRCKPPDEETRIRELVAQAASLAERHASGALLELTTPDFRGQPHDVTRDEVQPILLRAFHHYGQLLVLHPRPTVTRDPADPTRAEVETPFMIVRAQGRLPEVRELSEDPLRWLTEVKELGDVWHIRLKLVRVEDEWLVREVWLEGTRGRWDF